MRASSFLAAVSAIAFASAQDLTSVLAGQESLTTLVGILQKFPDIAEFIVSQEDATLLAPNNEAFAKILATGGIFSIDQAEADPGLIAQILRYHLLKQTVPSSAITPAFQFVPTYLDYSSVVLDGEVSGSNVTGGQVLGVNVQDGEVVVTSGIKAESKVTVADLEYDNGVVHIIDKLLTIPLQVSLTLITGNLTALAGAATEANIVTGLEEAKDITLFAPNNDAFQAIAEAVPQLSLSQLVSILDYHVVPTVAYSTGLSNTSIETLQGSSVEITVTPDGAAFVDGARIINTDILIPGGVIHVIDSVLSPATNDKQPTEIELPTDAAGTFVPFTSDIPPATSTYPELLAIAATTSFVAAPPPSGTMVTSAAAGSGSSNASMAGGASGSTSASDTVLPPQQTGNAGVKNQLPLVGAAVAIGAAAFAM